MPQRARLSEGGGVKSYLGNAQIDPTFFKLGLPLRAFVANQGLSGKRAFLDVLSRLLLRHCGFYSDFVQISAQKIGRWDLWSIRWK